MVVIIPLLASFPVPRPAFRHLQYAKPALLYCKRRKAGRGTGNEASAALHAASYITKILTCVYVSVSLCVMEVGCSWDGSGMFVGRD